MWDPSKTRNSTLSTFYLLVITQTISLIGSRMSSLAVGIWIFTETGLTTPLLLTAFFNELPGMLASSLAGVLIDRWDRKKVMILADAGQAAGSVILLYVFATGQFQVWQLYTVAIWQGIFSIFQQPAQDATTTLLVPVEFRERANGIRQMAFPLAGVGASVLTGLLYVLIGVTGIILIDLATFILAVIVVIFVTIPQPLATTEGAVGRGAFFAELRTGILFLVNRRGLFYFILYMTLINFLLNGPLELAIPYMLSVTGSEAVMGVLMGVMSLGAFSGAALVTFWSGTPTRMWTILGGSVLAGLMFMVYGTARTSLGLGLSIFLLVFPLPVGQALNIAILQRKTPPDMQGRIFAIILQMAFIGSTASFLLTGRLVDRILEPAVGSPGWAWAVPLVGSAPGAGIGLLLFSIGIIILIATAAILLQPQVRNLEKIFPDYQSLPEHYQDQGEPKPVEELLPAR